MELISLKILIGFVVGTLIGMTGLGGGVLLLPLLIFGLKVPAIVAVGSDAVFNFVTKIGSSWVHLSKGTVRRKVVVAGSPDPVMRNEVIPKFKERYGIPVEFIAGRSRLASSSSRSSRTAAIIGSSWFAATSRSPSP